MSRRTLPLLVLCLTAGAAAGAAVRWNDILKQPPEWYASAEARAVATSLLQYQTREGGWPKNTDMTAPPSAEFLAGDKFDHRAPTIDNKATTTQLEYLAHVITATNDAALRAAFERGFDYLLAAQYPSGGWPQYFPLIKGYYTHITYNDNAMVNVLTLLRDVAEGAAPHGFVDADRRARAFVAARKEGIISGTEVARQVFLSVDPTLEVEVMVPDPVWLSERRDKLVALVITHAHEDHVGAVAHLDRNAGHPLDPARGVAQSRALPRQPEIAGAGQGEPSGHGIAPDHGDRRLVQPAQHQHHRLHALAHLAAVAHRGGGHRGGVCRRALALQFQHLLIQRLGLFEPACMPVRFGQA